MSDVKEISMKFKGNKSTLNYAGRFIILVPIWLSLLSGSGFQDVGISLNWSKIAIGIFVSICIYLYWQASRKPFAEINGDILIIDSVNIEKEKIKKIEYLVYGSTKHELRVHMDGYQEWQINLTSEDVKLDGIPLYKFINENYCSVKLVKKKC